MARSAQHAHRRPRRWWNKALVRRVAVAVPATGIAAAAAARYVVLPSIHARHLHVPSLAVWAMAALVVPELCLLIMAVANVRNQDAYQRYIDLMMRWPYALVVPYIAVITRALPKRFFSDDGDSGPSEQPTSASPAEQPTSTPVEEPISQHQMSTADWSDAFRAQRTVIAALKRELEVQSTLGDELWRLAQEGRKSTDAKVVKPDS